MKISVRHALAAAICGVFAQQESGSSPSIAQVENNTLTAQNTYGGIWINPEDLTPMPQCVAQQDQSAWLSVMTECIHKVCIRHFGVICTHHQWLADLGCLRDGFAPDAVRRYMPYCGRSVLYKAQLYLWIHKYTDRTWLIDAGDADDVHDLTPSSLIGGYSDVDVTGYAPRCLTYSESPLSLETFDSAMEFCTFRARREHTGNAARPWEYNESLQSMVALDYETVGYDLTGRIIHESRYFDKKCLCDTFDMDPYDEPCIGRGQLELTKQRLWIYATCGSKFLPENWRDNLKTMGYAYIYPWEWYWPSYATDMTREAKNLPHQCTTEACEINSAGFCEARSVIDRSCVCRDISYTSCGASCHGFENRIRYVEWMQDLCGNVTDWHGLPDNWRQIDSPTTVDMIPWEWKVKSTEECASNEWKLSSFILVNIVTFLVACMSYSQDVQELMGDFLWSPLGSNWFLAGISSAILQVFGNWFNAFIVQSTSGYEDVPIIELMLLWCTVPRLAWIAISMIGTQPFKSRSFAAAKASLFAEAILQGLGACYMITTVRYGFEHNFYFGGLQHAERRGSATIMYYGALMWVAITGLALIHVALALCRVQKMTTVPDDNGLLQHHRNKKPTSNVAEDLLSQLDHGYTQFGDQLAQHWEEQHRSRQKASSRANPGRRYTMYGTLPVPADAEVKRGPEGAVLKLYGVMVTNMVLFCMAQCAFWGGFINLTSEEYCPPNLWALTVVWMFSQLQLPVLKLLDKRYGSQRRSPLHL
ncbi:hypothetical protein GQ44DRAFT_494358 [Phaeosphaeriaceae sp. PMI808]|nr:hypothetical protein GQ44DRAFT_494358 [Phaeosphaeriaceae sp. PMI808]